MRDIGRIQRRVENMEYYTQLSLLESDAKGMQIQDADGFDRFKNGIIVDNFTGHGVGEVSNADYRNSMDISNGELRPAFHQDNINLIESDSALENSNAMTDAIRTTNGYQKTGDLITLPYTSLPYITQDFASTTVNLNPYDVIDYIGNVKLTPDNDEWMATEVQPELTIDIPDVYDTLSDLASEGVLDLNLGTVWNNWNDSWTGIRSDTGSISSTSRTYTSGNRILKDTTTSVSTTERVDKSRTGIRTAMIPGGVQNHSLGNRVIQVGFATFIRAKTITFSSNSMKPLTRIFPFFDGVDISLYVTPTGSSTGAALTTDAAGAASGTFKIPDPTNKANQKWRVGTRSFRLTSSSNNTLVGDVFTSAETDYVAKGMIQQVQGTIISTREAQVNRTQTTETTSVQVASGQRIISKSTTVIGSVPQPSSGGGGGGGNNNNHITQSKNNHPFSTGNAGATKSSKSQPSRSYSNPPGGGRSYRSSGGCSRWDPVAQGIYIAQEDGIFVTSLDLFFSAKDAVLPVTVQLRTMMNGYPTTTIVPFGEITKPSSNVNVSTDASEATTFTFESPVFLQPNTEYAFVALCNTVNYTIYTARLGQTTLDGSRLISKQPYLSSMFKSQNAETWTPEQNETVKFTLNSAQFTADTLGSVYLVNDVIPTQLLKLNPIEVNATAGSGSTFGTNPAIIKINARNHGMHSTSHNVTIAGVPSGSFNGLASTNINGTYTAIGNITLDSFTVTAQNSDVATITGSIGASAVTVTKNIMYDIIQPVVGLVQPVGTTITSEFRKTGGRTLEQGETEFSLTSEAKEVALELNNDFYTTTPGMVCSQINETNEMSGSKSLVLKLTLRTETGNEHISPIFDTSRLSAHLIQNRLNKPVSGTTPEFVVETANQGGSVENKYITKPIILENESTALDIRITANVSSTSVVKMYYRLSNADDARKMGDLDWRPFNTDGSPDTAVEPSENRFKFREHKFSQSDLKHLQHFN